MNGGRICILTSMGWGVRNVLMSKAMGILRSRREIHILSNFNHFDAFRERFADLAHLEELRKDDPSRFTKLMFDWNVVAFYKISPSSTHQYKVGRRAKKSELKKQKREKKAKLPDKEVSLLRKLLNPKLYRTRAYRSADAFLNKYTARSGGRLAYMISLRLLRDSIRRGSRYHWYKDYFAAHGIDTVVSANPLIPMEYPALLAAEDMGLRRVAIITSWDNLSSKRPLVVRFDDYLVWNPIMAGEVKYYYRVDDRQIHEIGPLQFDYYFDERFLDSREAFCRRHGFDPGRKLVVYSTVTRSLLPDEPKIIEKLLAAMKDGRVKGSPNLLIRPHPKRPIDDFRPVMEDPRWKGLPVAWTEAGRPVWGKLDLWCPLDDEIRLLTNTVYHGDVNLNCFSTMMLDFAILDKPAVLICHNGEDDKLHYESYEHLKGVLACNGNRTGYTFEQTLDHLNTYLENPSLEREGRAAMVRMQCGPLLGQAWQRLAQAILGQDFPVEAAPVQAVTLQTR